MKYPACQGGLTLTWYWYTYVPAFWGVFREIWYSDRGGGVSSEMKEPKLHKLCVGPYFGQLIVKSTQFGQNWVLFFRKWYIDGGKLGKNWYRESQIFEVQQAHPRTILVKVTSPMI